MAEVNLDFLEPNSNKYKREKQEKSDLEPVIKKEALASTKKKGFFQTFIQRDLKDVMYSFSKDILIPGIKDGLLELVSLMLTGERLRERKPSSYYKRGDSSRERYSYNSCYNRSDDGPRNRRRDRPDLADEKVDYDNIVLIERADAEIIVEKMRRRIEELGEATIADLYRLVDVESNYQDANWGWKRTSDIEIEKVRDGFRIDVSEPKYLG